MKRRTFLQNAGLSVAALFSCTSAAKKQTGRNRPNIIMIMPDDIGYECHGCYGSVNFHTPKLDQLARDGMRFNHCHAQPLCTPTRVKIMTGRYNSRNYVRFGLLDTEEVTFGDMIKKAGYRTAIAGKWQLGGDSSTVKKFGFDRHCLWHLDGRDIRYWAPRLVTDGVVKKHSNKVYGPDVINDFALKFIEKNRAGPFFLYYPMCLTHWPFDPTPDSKEGGSKKKYVPYNDGGQKSHEYFPDMVTYMDKLVGKLASKLDELGIRENTLILYTGDNGTARDIQGTLKDGRKVGGKKGSMTDDGTKVALIASWKGTVKPGTTSDTLIDLTDFLPTIAEAAGTPMPTKHPIDGKSFLPVLLGTKQKVRDWIFCHYNPRPPKKPDDADKLKKALKKIKRQENEHKLGRWARTHRYKLYQTGDLYDLEKDPQEEHPIEPASKSAAAKAARAMLQKVHDSMPPWNPFAGH